MAAWECFTQYSILIFKLNALLRIFQTMLSVTLLYPSRLYPDISLTTLREELVNLLGPEKSIDKFSFLKCVGRSLALVRIQALDGAMFAYWL